MNIFYAPPEQIQPDHIELTGQEAIHAAKALRYRQGDAITVVNGLGGWHEGKILSIHKKTVHIHVEKALQQDRQQPSIVLAMGIIKKRARLEFAVEKATELGVQEIALFRGQHTVKQNVRMDRLAMTAIAAMKQSLQSWLPDIRLFHSLKDLIKAYPERKILAGHQKGEPLVQQDALQKSTNNYLLLVGPEGGFSDEELTRIEQEGKLVSLNPNRLRAETAAISLLNGFRILTTS